MDIFNVKTAAGLKELNSYLLTRSYFTGYTASQDDVSMFEALSYDKSSLNPAEHQHVNRWFNHIASFSADERAKWPASAGGSCGGVGVIANGQPADEAEDEDDVDLFGSESEDDEEKERIREERVRAYNEKKAKKPAGIAKSTVVFDVKPWDDEVDLKEVERLVRNIETDGLIWSTGAKILPVAYGINKLQIGAVVEDAKVSTDWLEEQILENEDLVQSVDIVAFQKV